MTTSRERAAVLALVEATEGAWYRTAALVEEVGSAQRILARDWDGLEIVPGDEAAALASRVDTSRVDALEAEVAELEAQGVRLVTILDEEYPANLREIYNRPPFLFVRGELHPTDERSVAVVGTRTASQDGLAQARRLATELARNGVTVLSGLARGIDSAAHAGALDAGGRTVAVLGHGILHDLYPSENRELAQHIGQHGALVSQFWPTAPPTRVTFPMRNVVMSGLGIGTVVVEASGHSGAKMQARLCLEHGKRLFLVESLVMQEDWARRYGERPGATVVRHVDDILAVLLSVEQAPQQLLLC